MDGVAHARAIYSADSPHNKTHTHTKKRTVNVRRMKGKKGRNTDPPGGPLLFCFLITIKKKTKIYIFFFYKENSNYALLYM